MTKRLPVSYNTVDGNIAGPPAQVVGATEQDIQQYGSTRTTCATCRHFRYQAGQRQMKEERFLDRLVLEQQWKVHHLGAMPITFGLCGMDDATLTSMHTKACEQYTPSNGRIREPGDW